MQNLSKCQSLTPRLKFLCLLKIFNDVPAWGTVPVICH